MCFEEREKPLWNILWRSRSIWNQRENAFLKVEQSKLKNRLHFLNESCFYQLNHIPVVTYFNLWEIVANSLFIYSKTSKKIMPTRIKGKNERTNVCFTAGLKAVYPEHNWIVVSDSCLFNVLLFFYFLYFDFVFSPISCPSLFLYMPFTHEKILNKNYTYVLKICNSNMYLAGFSNLASLMYWYYNVCNLQMS